jgi:hypothetical protein
MVHQISPGVGRHGRRLSPRHLHQQQRQHGSNSLSGNRRRGESVLGTSGSNQADFYCCGNNTDGNATVDVKTNINSPARFSDAFHVFGVLWVNDGVGNGAVSGYLDGSALYTGGRQGDWWGSGGAVIIMESVSCYDSTQVYLSGNACSGSTATSGNPITYKYFRYWQLVAG